jgi:hypothetical protein
MPSWAALPSKSAGGTTTLTVPLNATIAAGSIIVVARCLWLNTAVASDEAGWTSLADVTGGTGTTTDSHTTRLRVDYKIANGSEGGTSPVFDQTGTISGGIAQSINVVKSDTAKAWDIDVRSGTDNTHGTGRSVTFGSGMDVLPGDVLISFVAVDTDASFSSTTTGPTGTATFTVNGSSISPSATGVTTGVDGNIMTFSSTISGAGTLTAFSSDTTVAQCGPIAVVRFREVTAAATARSRNIRTSNPALRAATW